ncbi:DNA ligase 4 [Ananas comosus]|uniref:DNA ligase n=1 Tax=Ananas comosus TaxID=4615 RepID=A0A199VU45_ANACO|nr:DNA ligase 4 [Ananas comosus]
MTDATVRFGLLVSMFQAMLRDRSAAKKRRRLRTFLDRVYTGRDYFSAMRLVLPALDRERGSYGLKESALAAALVDALGLARDSPDALRLVNWRRGGASRAGANAGNFALVAAEVLQRRQGMTSGGLTIKELNDALDQLAATENRAEKASILSGLIKKTNALEMKWILMIILKDLKLGISEKSIFHEFHPDAEELFNVTCDLKLVCEKLRDRSQRHKRQDIEVGKPVRPQLAMRLHGKNVIVECKFDGDRIQIHKNGEEIHFFSRNFLDHPEYAPGMSKIIMQNILVDRCILDGEMLVWDTSTNRFAEFGSNQEIAKAAREGMESDRQINKDIAFDILYAGDTSVIHQSLAERLELLQKVVKPLKGQLDILIPNGGLNDHRPQGEPCWSIIAHNVEDVEKFFKETIENRDEGIVLKDLDSKWEPSDRSGKWLKLKPDYIHAGSDLDVLIIVGTGLSDEELDALISKLKPYFRKNDNPRQAPRFYEVTNNAKERPDVWIESPDKSVIVSITSDIRTIKSEVFAAPYSLRFPRIHRVRYDKPWHECLDVQAFVDLVHSSNGNTHQGPNDRTLQNHEPKRVRSTQKRGKKQVSVVPSHFVQTDISNVKGETRIFANMMFYFVNIPPSYSLDFFHKLVVENGGSFSMNLNDSVTHSIAAEKKGIKYQAAIRHGDIIHYSWILDCCNQKRLLLLQPKYFLSLADASKRKFHEEIDAYSDYYYWDIDIMDLKQMFSNMDVVKNIENIQHYKKKYCPEEKFCFFQGCCIYFYKAVPLINPDYNTISDLALKRMKLDVIMHSGEVCSSLGSATHLAVFSTLEALNFDELYKSFPPAQRRHLHKKRLHIVNSKWLEDSIENRKKLPEDAYNLKPDSLEELEVDKSNNELEPPTSTSDRKDQRVPRLINIGEMRKRGRTAHTKSRNVRSAPRPARRTRARIGNRPAKIDQDESEKSDSNNFGRREAFESGDESNKNEEPLVGAQFVKFEDESKDADLAISNENPNHTDPSDSKDKSEEIFDRSDAAEIARKGKGEKLEQMVDPLQAMLLDMIPSLSQRKAEEQAATSVSEVEKPTTDSNSSNNVVKKKVSYKDVAGQLLKDW